MKNIIPGTLAHYIEVARLVSKKKPKLTGSSAAINAHIGGQFFFSPHPMALEAHIHHTQNHTLLIGYLYSLAEKEEIPLTNLLKRFCPEKGYFIDLHEAYKDLWKRSSMNKLSFEDFLVWQKNEKIGSTGYLDNCHGQDESLALMKNYFQNLGLPVEENQVVMGTGFKNLFNALISVLMTKDVEVDGNGRDFRKRSPGTILVPRGHYQSLVKAPSFHNSRLKVIERIDATHIRKELENRGDIKAVYLSVVANPSGAIMPEEQMRGIAKLILEYNKNNKNNPVFIIADQVYNGSILKKELTIFSIASVYNKYASMHDYTITIVSPSKTLGYASARIGFAASGAIIPGDTTSIISRMKALMAHEGSDGVEVSTEVGVVAAYAFSSKKWIDENSSFIRSQLVRARQHVDSINSYLGYTFFTINNPDAGWYILSKFMRKNLPPLIKNSTDLMVYFMNYGHCAPNTGFITRPGSQFGYEAPNLPQNDFLILRSTLAMKPEDLDEFFRRFKEGILKLVSLKENELKTILKE
ncbi:MAG: pyridoxal phosphate-dependent aminotransferase [Spirochaetaceae bacterium]|nr:pyridoxal phosphate-dependent aminotransferase [Spirochaetaceae bacterium]